MVHNEILRAKDEVDHQFQTVKLQDEFREKGLQIIVKLGGIELAPDNPSFLGEDWHVDGLANEHIAGVALYCFDLGNVANPRISFAHEISMDADDFSFSYFNWDIPYLERLFGVQNEKPSFQELGSVSIRQGGLIAFPNCIYHRLESFELVDKARPGRCRFLTCGSLILTTASVPREMCPPSVSIGGNRKPDPIYHQPIHFPKNWRIRSLRRLVCGL